MKTTVFTFFLVLLAAAAHAQTAVVAVDAPADMVAARALQVLTLQALSDEGVSTMDPEGLRQPASVTQAREIATEAGAGRLFVLHLAPLSEAVLASLEEVALADGATLRRASLMIQTERDSARSLGRLTQSVLKGTPITEGQLVSTVTEGESQPYSKKPGEFLWGVSVFAGAGVGDLSTIPGLYGATFRFYYELPHVNFGVSLGGGGSEDGGTFEATVRANYLFSESDISGYLGGGLGISLIAAPMYDAEYGAHVMLSGGVEAFRLHAVRMVVGVDVMLPTYVLEGRTEYDWVEGQTIQYKAAEAYVVVPTFTVGILF